MRILYLETSMGLGGAEMLAMTLLEEWLRTGHDPRLLLTYRPGPLTRRAVEAGVPVESLGLRGGPRIVLGAHIVARRIRAAQPDVVILNNHDALLPWAWRLGRRAGKGGSDVPVVVVLHSTRVGRLTTSDMVHRLFLPRYSKVVPTGNPHAEYAHDRFGVPRAHLVPILNGIAEAPPTTLSSPLPRLPLGSVVGVILARLHPDKNHEGLFRAMKLLLADEPLFHLLVAGDGEHRARLEQCARELGIAANVHFLGVRRDVSAVLQHVDIGLITSTTTETFSVAVLEYMRAGLPVVATRVGSLTDPVRHGETGYLVEPGDTRALYLALREVVRSPELRKRLGTGGRALQQREFTAARMAGAFIDLFETLRVGPDDASHAGEAQPAPVVHN